MGDRREGRGGVDLEGVDSADLDLLGLDQYGPGLDQNGPDCHCYFLLHSDLYV